LAEKAYSLQQRQKRDHDKVTHSLTLDTQRGHFRVDAWQRPGRFFDTLGRLGLVSDADASKLCAYILVSVSRTNAEDDDDNNSHHCTARLAAWRGRRILRTPPVWRKRIRRRPRPDRDYTSGAMANRLAWSRANITCVRSIGFPNAVRQPGCGHTWLQLAHHVRWTKCALAAWTPATALGSRWKTRLQVACQLIRNTFNCVAPSARRMEPGSV
jgi:hypothetical protein